MSCPEIANTYTIEHEIGHGTYGKVLKAHKKNKSSQNFAIKLIKKASLNAIGQDNIVSEIEILKSLHHDHIVSMINFEWDAQFIYLVMEYCAGGDLSHFIKEVSIVSESIAKRFLQQLALALEYLHSKSIVHMDLKPHNILLTSKSNPKLKIADFGFAKYIKEVEDLSNPRGSFLYMAPEIYLNAFYHPKCDLWSTGVILFECLFGYAPFKSATIDQLKQKISDSRPIPIPGEQRLPNPSAGSSTLHTTKSVAISEELDDLLQRLLTRDVTARISHEEFFAHPFLDLEFAPQSNSIEKAKKIMEEAKTLENAYEKILQLSSLATAAFRKPMDEQIHENQQEAKKVTQNNEKERELRRKVYAKYITGLNHMIAALYYTEDSKEKEKLRQLIKNKMAYVEAMKQRHRQRERQQRKLPVILTFSRTSCSLPPSDRPRSETFSSALAHTNSNTHTYTQTRSQQSCLTSSTKFHYKVPPHSPHNLKEEGEAEMAVEAAEYNEERKEELSNGTPSNSSADASAIVREMTLIDLNEEGEAASSVAGTATLRLPPSPPQLDASFVLENEEILTNLCANSKSLSDGLSQIAKFYELTRTQKFTKAFNYFLFFFPRLEKLVKEDTNQQRKKLYKLRLIKSMEMAEKIKEYLAKKEEIKQISKAHNWQNQEDSESSCIIS